MENDYRITKLHGTLIGDNRIPDIPDSEKTKVFSSTNGKTAWVDLPEDGKIETINATVADESIVLSKVPTSNYYILKADIIPHVSNSYVLMTMLSGSGETATYVGMTSDGDSLYVVATSGKDGFVSRNRFLPEYSSAENGKFLSVVNGDTKWSDLPEGGKELELIEVSNATINPDGSYTYTLPNKPTSNPYILKTVDSGESDYYLMTGDSDVSFGMRPIALTDSLFGGNFMVVSGTTATQRPTNFPPQPKSADNGKVLTVNNGYPSWETAGGASVSPCLNLMNLETDSVRTSITEEEKNNLDKGLYTSVFYHDKSWVENADISMTLPQLLTKADGGIYMATIYTGSISNDIPSISGFLVYGIGIGEKNTDGTYPISIMKTAEIPFASSGGGSGVDNYLVKDIVDDSVTLTNDEFKKLAESNCTLVLRSTRGNSIWYYISSLKIVSSENGAVSEIKVTAFTWMSSGNISVSDSYDLTFTPDSLTSNVTRTETSISPAKLFNKFDVLTNDFTLTNILPCSTTDNGKALSVVNGEAQWADLGTTYSKARYEHTVTIKNSEGKILWTQTMRNSSNTIVNSYTNLKTLFGGATYAGFGEYCQLDLRGGTEATDKLIKLDGTEATLASLGAIVYSDDCFLPK